MLSHRKQNAFVLIAVMLFLAFLANSHSHTSKVAASSQRGGLSQATIMEEFKKVSTGKLADAVDQATGQRGFMFHDMKPIFRTKIVGPAATAILRPVLKSDKREYPN
jgi:hypothetical protein